VRILIWPTYSYPGNVGADSLYLIARNLIRASQDPSVHWVLLVPDSKSVPQDDLDSMENVQKVVSRIPPNYRLQEAVADPEIVWRYHGAVGEEPVDAVLSMSPARSVNIGTAWEMKASSVGKQLVATWDLLVRDDGNGEFSADRNELVQQAAGSLMSDVIYHESPVARKMTMDIARRFLSPSAVRTIHSISQDVPQGISVAQIAPIVLQTPKREQFTLYYGGRFSGSKRLADIAEVVDKFYAYGRDVKFVVTTGSLDGMKRAKFEAAYPQVELHVGKSQEEAWALMAGCHASFCFSSHELFGMAFWEQMAAGLGVVMLAKEWNRELVPPGYNLIVDTPGQAAAMLRVLHQAWEEDATKFEIRYGRFSQASNWVKVNYDADKNLGMLADDLIGRVRSIEADAAVKFADGKAASLQEALEVVLQDEVLTLRQLWAGIREHSRVGTNFIGKRMTWPKSNSYLDALRLARWLGWEDCFVNGEAAIRKAV
jgi:glycosyltransferase involved in cell wall biosynthesis